MRRDITPENHEVAVGLANAGPFTEEPTPISVSGVRLELRLPPASSGQPDSGAEKFSKLDWAYLEFCRRRDEGEKLDPDLYLAQFPSLKSSLGRLLHAQLCLEEREAVFASMAEPRWPRAGEVFLDYHLILLLGKGAFARVFLAIEPRLGNRLVAVKVALHGSAEAEVLGRLKHPNIVPVHSVQEDQATGLTAVCMPYLGSATLCDVLDNAVPLSSTATQPARIILDVVENVRYPLDPAPTPAPARVLRHGVYIDGIRLIGAQLADALAFIHERGIQHRDLKPSNVLMSPEGIPMLLDFNLCADVRETLQRLGGTFAYMSPEQLRATAGDAQSGTVMLDARADIFSLGVMLYQLVAGVHPFGPVPLKLSSAALRRYLLDRQQQGAMQASRVNTDVDAAFSQLIQRCLAFDPKGRPQSAAEIATVLRRGLMPLPRTKRWLGRHPRKVLVSAVLFAAVGLAGAAFAALRPPFSERQVEAGLQLHQQGRYAEAVHHFNHALQTDLLSNEALFARAHSQQMLGSIDKNNYHLAMQGYAELDQRSPHGGAKAGIGYCLNRTNNHQAANEYYQLAIQNGFSTAEVYNNLGYCQIKLGQLKEARHSLDQAIQRNEALQAAYHNRALLALGEAVKNPGQFSPNASMTPGYLALKSGIADAQKALDLGAGTAELHHDAARLYAVAARVEKHWVAQAMRHLEESVKLGYQLKKGNDALFTPLHDEAAYKALAKAGPATVQSPPTQRLLDPAN